MDNSQTSISGEYYDGLKSKAQLVTVFFKNQAIDLLDAQAGEQKRLAYYAAGDFTIEERFDDYQRISFINGSFCKIKNSPELQQYLKEIKHKTSIAEMLVKSHRILFITFLCLFALSFLGYRFGLPVFSEYVAQQIPENIVAKLDETFINQLNAAKRISNNNFPVKEQLLKQYARFQFANKNKVSVQFLKDFPPNAFALPGGHIFVSDKLLMLLNAEQALAVIAHEAAHVEYRHGIQTIISQGVIAAGLSAWFGDFSDLVIGAQLLQLNYSRAFENQADKRAIELLQANAYDGNLLAEWS